LHGPFQIFRRLWRYSFTIPAAAALGRAHIQSAGGGQAQVKFGQKSSSLYVLGFSAVEKVVGGGGVLGQDSRGSEI